MTMAVEQVSFPQNVFRGRGALPQIGAYCKELGGPVFVLGGKTALGKTQAILEASLQEAGVKIAAVEWYGGECTQDNIDRLAAGVRQHGAKVIIAVGGGKALDTGKLTGDACGVPVVTVPTIAATCAAATPVAVLYDNDGIFIRIVSFPNCPVGMIIDTDILLAAPAEYLSAGLGDTLAKWYEYRAAIQCVEQNSLSLAALAQGRLCYDLVARFGGEAQNAVATKQYAAALEAAADAIILYAGMALIYGGEKLRSAAAHALYNAFTIIPEAHEMGHGRTVGYGNLCLLALEGRPDEELLEAVEIAKACGVPVTSQQIAKTTAAQMEAVAAKAVSLPDMKNMPLTVTTEKMLQAIARVDALNS